MTTCYQPLSFVVARCYSFPLVVTRCTTRCHSIYHSPVFLQLNKSFLKFTFNGENKSIDQSMISYFANHSSRQRINNKPVAMGFNIWVLAEAYGYLVQFEPYQGVKRGKQVASSTNWGLGENVVLRLMKSLLPTIMNNYFTSFLLLTHLGVNNI